MARKQTLSSSERAEEDLIDETLKRQKTSDIYPLMLIYRLLR